MNLASIFVLALILVGVCAAVRVLRRGNAHGCGCGCCAKRCEGCEALEKCEAKPL